MEVHLKILVGSNARRTIKVVGPKFFIGRSEECQLRPHSDLISRHHCAIIVENTYVAVRDFGSKNGTYVNGERLSAELQLTPGDHLKVGPLEFEVCFDPCALSGPKRPPVSSVKEAAERTADSSRDVDETDLADWLAKDVSMADTRKNDPSDTTTDDLTLPADPVPPSKPGEEKKQKSGSSSDEAAAEMLRKLRRFR